MLTFIVFVGCCTFIFLPVYLLINNCADFDADITKKELTLVLASLGWFITSCIIIGNTLH